MKQEYINLLEKANSHKKEIDALFVKILSMQKKDVDKIFYRLHQDIFYDFDCIDCALCCSSLGPRLTESDIKRSALALKMNYKKFIFDYLKIDEDGDYVFKEMPCPLLCNDNLCMIYTDRPRACRMYPHTNEGMTKELIKITAKNVYLCPAVAKIVFLIMEEIK